MLLHAIFRPYQGLHTYLQSNTALSRYWFIMDIQFPEVLASWYRPRAYKDQPGGFSFMPLRTSARRKA